MNGRISKRINKIASETHFSDSDIKNVHGTFKWPVGTYRDTKKRLKRIYREQKKLGIPV